MVMSLVAALAAFVDMSDGGTFVVWIIEKGA